MNEKIYNSDPQKVKMSDLALEKFKNEEYLDFSDPTHDSAQKKALADVRSDFGKE